MPVAVEILRSPPIEDLAVEIVERKGVGHPDYICDAICEQASIALCKEYLRRFGAIMHHNIDKGLLVAGRVEHAFGGGRVLEPMKLIFGDRATFRVGREVVPVNDIVIATAKRWIKRNLRFVDPEKHMRYVVELKEGSAELRDIFLRKGRVLGANDTSAAVGYAPLSRTERIVYATERWLNSKAFKKSFPETGEDIKVMGTRSSNRLTLTIALPLLERFVRSEVDYFRRKKEILEDVKAFVTKESERITAEQVGNSKQPLQVDVAINTLDKPGRGLGGVYLTLLGTSAEDADCGQVGRGNRVNGVIALNRPLGTEAAAGKNPVSHVGKIYNILTHKMANEIVKSLPDVREVYVWLCSQIGVPINQPKAVATQLILRSGAQLSRELIDDINSIIERELGNISRFCQELAMGKYAVC